jgi:hypothetical protein
MPATLTAPKQTALRTLRHAAEPGSFDCLTILESLGRKAGIEAHGCRMRYYGPAWIEAGTDPEWRSRDAVRAVRELQWSICRELTPEENGAFVVAMIDLMHDLV